MPPRTLAPTLGHLMQEHLLVPAWKKAHDYIRRHNWYSDVLELDLTNADLGATIKSLASEIDSDEPLFPTPLRLVLAPKTQAWEIQKDQWKPVGGPAAVEKKLRPLAHLAVRDQILATAFMMLLADVVETRQGDPRLTVTRARETGMVSYGHRLFCDKKNDSLKFRWGNAVVYRQYFQDYQNFIARPEQTVQQEFSEGDANWAMISADLSQFYDRVRPEMLHCSVRRLLGAKADEQFIDTFETFFNWSWQGSEAKEARNYAGQAKPHSIPDFDRIALPQGLVSSGFFSNVVLLDFDDAIVGRCGSWNASKEWQLLDYCRYVDDMRFVVRLSKEIAGLRQAELEDKLITSFSKLLTELLDEHAPGLIVNPDKCDVIIGKNAAAGSVRVSSGMQRVNHNASGVMDLFVGEETLELIETLLYSSETNNIGLGTRFQDTVLGARPDVREDTVARFAANRFRSAFRTLRPMSETALERQTADDQEQQGESEEWNSGRFRLSSTLTRELLDEKATHFASRLVERWIRNPSNMRLLRVALDLRPDVQMLDVVLELLNEYLDGTKRRKAPRRVAWYCAAELLKAGATETGLVDDEDKLPSSVDLQRYQKSLAKLAREILARRTSFPWYVVQQAYLFLACYGDYVDHRVTQRLSPALRHYVLLHKVLRGEYRDLRTTEVPKFSLLHAQLRPVEAAADAFLKRWRLESDRRKRRWLVRILSENRQLGLAVRQKMTRADKRTWRALFEAYGTHSQSTFSLSLEKVDADFAYSLLDVSNSPANPFQHEYLAIHLAVKLIPLLDDGPEVVTPNHVFISTDDWTTLDAESFPLSDGSFEVELNSSASSDIRFRVPEWVDEEDRWKYQLGMLLRVLLTGIPDYTLDSRSRHYKSHVMYRPYRSSWLRRRYGLFNGRNAFGPPWIPVSSWFGSLLNQLLQWPGFPDFEFEPALPDGCAPLELEAILRQRLKELEELYGRSSRMPLLSVAVPKALGLSPNGQVPPLEGALRRMRIGVAQTVIPRQNDFLQFGSELSDPAYRRRHRRHSASVLAGLQRMLEVRTTHESTAAGIELLILPELSIHPLDVKTVLYPFVMQNRCIVCAGMVFHSPRPGGPLVNQAVWLVPIRRPTGGLDIQTIYQGKQHMTQGEVDLGISPFRPAQWIFKLVDPRNLSRPLWSMTSAVCYDATDLSLAADLRDITDLFIVPALNVDVGTFDNMAAALHYHMFQHVIVANTGEYGGSSAHAPFREKAKRTIFHTHGNEQVAVSFFEIDFDLYRNGNPSADESILKSPPANHRRR